MTKEITKANILQEIQDKFKLRELIAETFAFSEMVTPTYDVGPHLIHPYTKTLINSITGTGAKPYFTVPENEKWHLHGYNVIFMTGVFTIAGVMVYHPDYTHWLYLDLKAAQNTSYSVVLPKDEIIASGEALAINIDGYTSTGNLELRVDISVETIR